jgi:putative membrane protein
LDALNVRAITITIIFAILAYLFVGLNPLQASHSLPVLFISGFTAICAMLLPGISGSSLLLLLGQYEYMIAVLHRISIVEIIVFIAGAGCGFMIMSRIIKYLLENHKQLTVAALIGIMLGSLRVPMQNIVTGDMFSLIICLVIGIIGMLIVLFIDTKFNYEII